MGEELSDDPYRIAELYDLEYAYHREDIGWYTQLARAAEGPVLELGCGTGRLTLPMAHAGATVVGVDRAPAMLEGLAAKLVRAPPVVQRRVQLVAADYRSLQLDQLFGAVLWPFNALHHCAGPTDVAEVLCRIRGWLAPGGSLALDCYLPDLELYDRDPDERFEPRSFTDPRSGQLLQSWEQGWWDAATHTHHVLYVYEHPDGRQERAHLALRMYELDELRTLVEGAGWRIVSEAMDFEETPLHPDALKWVARLRPSG